MSADFLTVTDRQAGRQIGIHTDRYMNNGLSALT